MPEDLLLNNTLGPMFSVDVGIKSEDFPQTGRAFMRTFDAREDFKVWANNTTVTNGYVVFADALGYVYKEDELNIFDIPGWSPVGRWSSGHFGLIGDGTDKTDEIEEILKICSDKKKPIDFEPGIYGFTNIAVFKLGGFFNISSPRGKTIFKQLSTRDAPTMAFNIGGALVLSTSLTSTVVQGEVWLTLASTIGVQIGDLLRIETNRLQEGDHRFDKNRGFGQTGVIKEISGNNVRLSDPMVWDYKVGTLYSGAATAGTTGNMTTTIGSSLREEEIKGYEVVLTGGTGAGQRKFIHTYASNIIDIGTSYTGFPQAPFSPAPNNTTTFQIVATVDVEVTRPAELLIQDLEFEGYEENNVQVRGLNFRNILMGEVSGLRISGFSNNALYTSNCYRSTVRGCWFDKANYGFEDGGGLGYGHVDQNGYANRIIGNLATGCRTGFDTGSTTLFLHRQENVVSGGGKTYDGVSYFMPNGTVPNSGMSTHCGAVGTFDVNNISLNLQYNKMRSPSRMQGHRHMGWAGLEGVIHVSYCVDAEIVGCSYNDVVTGSPTSLTGLTGRDSGFDVVNAPAVQAPPLSFVHIRHTTMPKDSRVVVKGCTAKSVAQMLVYIAEPVTTRYLDLTVEDNDFSVLSVGAQILSVVKAIGSLSLRGGRMSNNRMEIGGTPLGDVLADNYQPYYFMQFLTSSTPAITLNPENESKTLDHYGADPMGVFNSRSAWNFAVSGSDALYRQVEAPGRYLLTGGTLNLNGGVQLKGRRNTNDATNRAGWMLTTSTLVIDPLYPIAVRNGAGLSDLVLMRDGLDTTASLTAANVADYDGNAVNLSTGSGATYENLAVFGFDYAFKSNGLILLDVLTASGTGTTATLTFAAQASAPYAVGSVIAIDACLPATYNIETATVTACTTTSVSYISTATGALSTAGRISNATNNARLRFKDLNIDCKNGIWLARDAGGAEFNNVRCEANLSGTSPSITTTGASGTGTVATLTFAAQAAAPLPIGAMVSVSGVLPAGYNGSWVVTGCTIASVSFACTESGSYTQAGRIIAADVNIRRAGTGIKLGDGVCRVDAPILTDCFTNYENGFELYGTNAVRMQNCMSDCPHTIGEGIGLYIHGDGTEHTINNYKVASHRGGVLVDAIRYDLVTPCTFSFLNLHCWQNGDYGMKVLRGVVHLNGGMIKRTPSSTFPGEGAGYLGYGIVADGPQAIIYVDNMDFSELTVALRAVNGGVIYYGKGCRFGDSIGTVLQGDCRPMVPLPQRLWATNRTAKARFSPLTIGPATATVSFGADAVRFYPMYIPDGVTVDRLEWEVTTAVVGNARAGLYEHNEITGGPGLRVFDSGNVSTNAVAVNAHDISAVTFNGRRFWVALHSSVAVTIRAGAANGSGYLGTSAFNTAAIGHIYVQTFAALPADASALALGLTGTGAYMELAKS